MNELLIRISSTLYECSKVTVNGLEEDFVRNKRGSYELKVVSDKNVEIQVERKHELLSPAWLFWGLFFFVISCFGIFDVRYATRGAVDCKVNVTAHGNGTVQLNPIIKGDKAVNVIANDCVVEELENSSSEALLKKRRKTLRIIKLLSWAALIAAIVLIVIM